RDLLPALPLFAVLGFLSGATAQLFYGLIPSSLTRGLAWGFWGVAVGAGIGMLRRDFAQTLRGAFGGALGGFIGGFIFNSLAALTAGDDAATDGGALSRAVGLMITGAMIGLMIRVVQDALRSAWLEGITTGYEGKQYPLNN